MLTEFKCKSGQNLHYIFVLWIVFAFGSSIFPVSVQDVNHLDIIYTSKNKRIIGMRY